MVAGGGGEGEGHVGAHNIMVTGGGGEGEGHVGARNIVSPKDGRGRACVVSA